MLPYIDVYKAKNATRIYKDSTYLLFDMADPDESYYKYEFQIDRSQFLQILLYDHSKARGPWPTCTSESTL